jgi:formate-dependent nitrite reductase membrane component NrfD
MLFQSNTGRPMIKWWSPMSAGSWGLTAFGIFSFASFVGVLAEDGHFGLGPLSDLASRLRVGITGRMFAFGGAISAFFLASYTGVLLGATNQPVWSNTTWTGGLFLTSALSSGVAAIILLDRVLGLYVSYESQERLERFDTWALGTELITIGIFMASLGKLAGVLAGAWPGILVPAVVVPFGIAAPAVLQRIHRRGAIELAAALALAGGFALRMAIVGSPTPFLLSHHR